jgi:type VI secretion system protein
MPVCPDYGVAAVSEMVHAFPEAISLMARTIRQTIQAYEPRLTNVQVRHVPSEDMILRFDITAQIVVEGSKTPVRFETTIDTSRKLSIH